MCVVRTIAEAGYDNVPMVHNIVFSHQHVICLLTVPVMTTLRKMLDFVYFLPFLFTLYHYSESSGTFYPDPHTTVMTHTLDHAGMT